MNIFCSSIDAVENADNTISEIKSQIDGMARAVFGPRCMTMITVHTDGQWSARVYDQRYQTFAEAMHETLADCLHLLVKAIEERRQKDALVAATLGIVTAEAAE